MRVIHFEDQGQDFLRWYINNDGVVVHSCPFQGFVWNGVFVAGIAVGERPLLKRPERPLPATELNYRVVRIEELNPFMNDSGSGAMDVASRLDKVERFDLIDCLAALEVPGLQKSVEKRLRSRIRKLDKARGESHG